MTPAQRARLAEIALRIGAIVADVDEQIAPLAGLLGSRAEQYAALLATRHALEGQRRRCVEALAQAAGVVS